jgi:putative oxidoreductase
MLVAVLIVHGADPFNVKEKAVLFLIAFVSVLILGPGKYSLDKK